MPIPLPVMLLVGILLGVPIVTGLVAKEANWRTLAVLLVMTIAFPAWFYFLY